MTEAASDQRCEACGGLCTWLFAASDVNRRISAERFEYHRCAECGVVFLKNRPADLARYYGGGYFTTPASLLELERIGRRMQPKLEIVEQFQRGGRLLEIGPGMGTFAWLAKRAGFDVDVIEQDVDACDFLKKVVTVSVTQTSSPEQALAATKDRYDVVVLWHAVEHLPRAWDTLAQCIRVLNHGGVLIVATPNPRAWQFRQLGARWPHIDAPRHLWLIPLEAMDRYTRRLGASLEWATTNDPEGKSWNQFGWSQAVRNLMPAVLRNSFAGRVASRAAGSLAAQVLRPWESVEFNGSAYTAVFRKLGDSAGYGDVS